MILQAPPVSNIKQYLEGHPWLDINDINVIIPGLIHLVLVVAAIVFFILLLLAGIQWMTAGGDKEAMTNAKKRLTSALIGIVIVFSAWAILNLVKYFFNIFETTTPTPSCEICNDGTKCCPPNFCGLYECH